MTGRILNSFQFNLFQQILSTEGLALSENFHEVYELRIQRFALLHGFQLDHLPYRLKEDEALRIALAESLIVHESYFYREPHHFNAMIQHTLPKLTTSTVEPISILSAGCAAGEEAYSIRIFFIEARPHLSRPIEITGIDRSRKMIDAAQNGHYSAHSLREMPDGLVEKYFTKGKTGLFSPKSYLREGVNFSQSDLLKESLGEETYDIIFCRNVMMYLTTEAREKLKLNLESALKPDGSFFFGTTETFSNPPETMQSCRFGNTFFYEKTGNCP